MNDHACSFEEAALNHLRDALRLPTEARWRWLQQAMDFGFATARRRAVAGLVTLGPHGEVMWSPVHERSWANEQRPPHAAELEGLGRVGS